MKWITSFIVLLCLTFSCNVRQSSPDKQELTTSDPIEYARGFTIKHYADYTVAELRDPWDSTRILQRYLLVDRNKKVLPEGMPKGTLLRTPLRRMVVYNSVHTAILEELGVAGDIVGVCESRYMDSPAITTGLKNGAIADLGEATSPNVEEMVNLSTEVIIASPFRNAGYGPAEKLGIPILECADYMESTPLGRAEWIRFYGLLVGKEQEADAAFRKTEANYLVIKALADSVSNRPTVLTEKKFGSSWFVPAGDSYMGNFLRDAGANYIFSDLEGAGSVPLAFETVLDKAIHADIWIVKYNQADEMTYADLRTEYTPYEHFDAFKKHHIYTCNSGKVPIYEEFPMHPDYLLKDLLWVIHPELLPDYTPRYYRQMNQ